MHGHCNIAFVQICSIRLIWSLSSHKQLVPQDSRGCQDARTEASTIRDANALLQPKPLESLEGQSSRHWVELFEHFLLVRVRGGSFQHACCQCKFRTKCKTNISESLRYGAHFSLSQYMSLYCAYWAVHDYGDTILHSSLSENCLLQFEGKVYIGANASTSAIPCFGSQ